MGAPPIYEVTTKAISEDADGLIPSKRNPHEVRPLKSFFTGIQWTADGTTLFTTSSSKRVSSYVLPNHLLDSRLEPIALRPSSTIVLSENSAAIVPYPGHNLSDPSTHLVLTACSDIPIQVHQMTPRVPEIQETGPGSQAETGSDLDSDSDVQFTSGSSESSSEYESDSVTSVSAPSPPSTQVASYPLRIHENETYPKVFSLIWPNPTRFIAGTKRLIAIFDINHSPEPSIRIKTDRSQGGMPRLGKNGIVSALAVQPNSWLLAAGTYSRKVALYDAERAGECVATWDVADATKHLIVDGLVGGGQRNIGGNGIVQTVWSHCGQYLVVNERKANGLLVYDLRNTHEILSCLIGRPSDTNQRLNCDVYQSPSKSGFEVWAGADDGTVAVWEDVGADMGYVEPTFSWNGHSTAVGGTAIHSSGSVLATCSGHWEGPSLDEGAGPPETNLKVWSISSGGAGP